MTNVPSLTLRATKRGPILSHGDVSVDLGTSVLSRGGRSVCISPMQARTLYRLLLSINCEYGVSRLDLIDWLYGDSPDGGPLVAAGCVRTRLFELAPVLDLLNIRVAATDNRGGRKLVIKPINATAELVAA